MPDKVLTPDLTAQSVHWDSVPLQNKAVVVGPNGAGKSFMCVSTFDSIEMGRDPEIGRDAAFPSLLDQRDKIRLERQRTGRSPSHQVQPEAFTFTLDDQLCGMLPWAGEDAFHGKGLKTDATREAIGLAVVVYAVCPLQFARVARHSVRAMAVWASQERGMTASEAILFSIHWHYELGPDVAKVRTRHRAFTERVAALLNKAKWDFKATRSEPADRYPLLGLTPTEAEEVNYALEMIIDRECDEAGKIYDHFRTVLRTVDRVVLTFTKLDGLRFMPGVQLDLVDLANDLLPGRHGLTLVSGKYGETAVVGEGPACVVYTDFSTEGPARLMEAIKSEIRAGWARPDPLDAEPLALPAPEPQCARSLAEWARPHQTALAVTAAALPLALLVAGLLGWLGTVLVVLAAALLVGVEVGAAFLLVLTHRGEPPTPLASDKQPPAVDRKEPPTNRLRQEPHVMNGVG